MTCMTLLVLGVSLPGRFCVMDALSDTAFLSANADISKVGVMEPPSLVAVAKEVALRPFHFGEEVIPRYYTVFSQDHCDNDLLQ